MDLQEEYYKRRQIKAPMIKYTNSCGLFLKAKNGSVKEQSLYVSITETSDNREPGRFHFVVSPQPFLRTGRSDPYNGSISYGSISYSGESRRNIYEDTLYWGDYEEKIYKFSGAYSKDYRAIVSDEALIVLWRNFLVTVDNWLSTYIANNMTDVLELSLIEEKCEDHIKSLENWLKDRHDTMYQSWCNVKKTIDNSNYADWLAHIVNGTYYV